MTVKTAAALTSDADTDLANNTTGAISAAHNRDIHKNHFESAVNRLDDINVVASWRAKVAKFMTTDVIWDSAAEVTLTDAATIAVDMSLFINATVTLTANRALGNPTNEKVGQSGIIRVVQDATGSRTLSFGTDYEFAGGTAPTLSTAANAEDLLFYQVLATNRIFISSVLDIS